MVGSAAYVKKRVFITAKTYPSPARKGVEVSCTGGITDQGEWIRIFPVPFRYLSGEQRFKKYQWISIDAIKASDPRPESYRINIDSIDILSEPVSTKRSWEARKQIISPLQAHCMCCLRKTWRQNRQPTLGFFKPKTISRLVIEPDSAHWSPEQKEKLDQSVLFDNAPFQPLEKIPYKFIYEFMCDERDCRGHRLSCVDWEINEAYRKWRKEYGSRWQWAIRNRFETEMVLKRDTHFFVGTVSDHPGSWIIVGLFYPPKEG